MSDPQMRARLAAACERLLGPIDSMHALEDSSSGCAFVVGRAGRRFHARLVHPQSMRTLPLEAEYALLDAVASAGLGPAPVAFDAGDGVLVTEFLEAHRSLTCAELSEPAILGRACALLARLHAVPAALPVFDAAATARRYIDAVARHDAAGRALADELHELAVGWVRHAADPVLCHGDPVAANFMLGPKLLLVDFEYAQLAPPLFDLAWLSVMNDFSAEDDRRMLAEYFADRAVPFSLDDFAKVRRMVALISHFWALGQGPARSAIARYVLD